MSADPRTPVRRPDVSSDPWWSHPLVILGAVVFVALLALVIDVKAQEIESTRGWHTPRVEGMSGRGGTPVKVSVSPWRGFGPREVKVTATITPDPENDLLVIVIDGPKYLRQDIELNTQPDDDRRTFERRFPDVPSGAYVVRAVVVRGTRQFSARASFCLIGMFEPCD